jgi:hypothetical protein
MSESFSARRSPFSLHELSLDCLEQAEESVRPAAAVSSDPTIEQIRAVQGTLNFLTALMTFYGEMLERDALSDTGQDRGKGAGLQS